MIIKNNTTMILFRYNNYKKKDFINEHKNVLNTNDYVWMLKLGKKSSIEKINKVKDNGGFMILKAPKSDGGTTYIAKFSEIIGYKPNDNFYPKYYNDILNSDNYLYWDKSFQWFKIEVIKKLSEENMEKIVLINGKKPVNDVIHNTMTAFMFVENSSEIKIEEEKND